MIHGKCHTLNQLVFAVDAAMTTDKCNDNIETAQFITTMKGKKPRAGMTKIGEHLYKLGRSSEVWIWGWDSQKR